MKEVELKLIAPSASAVKSIREVAAEAQKLHKNEEVYTQKRKGLIEKEIQMQKQLGESRQRASNIENLKIYNKLLDDSKKRLNDLEKAGISANKEVEKSSDGVISKIGKMAIAYLTVRTAVVALKETVLAFFTKSQEGVKLLERKMAGLKAAVGVLQGEFIKLGKSFIGENAEAPTKWGDRIATALKLIGTTANVLPVFRKWVEDLRIEMNGAAVAAEEYTRISQELEDAERAMIVPRAKATAAIADARLKYSEANGTIEERIELLQKAIDLEREVAEDEIKHQQFVILNMRNRNIELEKRGMLMDTDRKELEQAIAQEIELQTESNRRQMRSINSLRTLKIESAKAANDEIKKAQDAFNKYWDKVDKEEYDRIKKAAEDTWNFELKIGKMLFEQNQRQAKEEWDILIKGNEAQKKAAEELLKMRQESLQKMGEYVLDYISIIDQLSQKEVERTQRQRELLDTRVDEAQSALEVEADLYKAGYASNVEAKKKELAEMKIQRDKALAEEEKARKKQHTIEIASLLAQKAVDVAKIISSTAVANAKAIALSPLTFGQPWVGINTAAAALGIAAAAAAVVAASTAKYAKGGWTGEGKYKDSTGERMAGIVHEKEFVVRRGPAHKYRGMLEAINRNDQKMILNSFNKVIPGASNNILVENTGPNKRLDEVNSNLRQIRSKEEVTVLGNMTIYKKGNSTRVIKR